MFRVVIKCGTYWPGPLWTKQRDVWICEGPKQWVTDLLDKARLSDIVEKWELLEVIDQG